MSQICYGVIQSWNGGWRGSGLFLPEGGGYPLVISCETRREPVHVAGVCTGFKELPKPGRTAPPPCPVPGSRLAYAGRDRRLGTAVRDWAVVRLEPVLSLRRQAVVSTVNPEAGAHEPAPTESARPPRPSTMRSSRPSDRVDRHFGYFRSSSVIY